MFIYHAYFSSPEIATPTLMLASLQCSPLMVQLSLDMQLYFLGALVVWLYFTDPEAGFFLCGAFHAVSVAARYSRTHREHLAPSLFHGIQ